MLGTAPTIIPAAPSRIGGNWVRVLDVDFTAQPSQSLATDGTYTIGGSTFTKYNSSGDAVAAALVNGTGIVLTPVASTDIFQTTFTLPTIAWQLTQLPKLAYGMPIRVYAQMVITGAAANYDGGVTGILCNGSTQMATAESIAIKRGVQFGEGFVTTGNANATTLGNVVDNKHLTDDVFAVEATNGLPMVQTRSFSVPFGAGTDWPDFSTFNCHSIYPVVSGISNQSIDLANGPIQDISRFFAFVGAQRAGSTTSGFAVTVTRMRVDYLPTAG